MAPTIEYEDTLAEVHKVVVGPDGQQRLRGQVQADRRRRPDRRRQRARAAARAVPGPSESARCSRPMGTGTTSRPSRPSATPGTRSGSPPPTPAMLPSYDMIIDDDVGDRGRQPPDADRRHARATPRARSASPSRELRSCLSGDTLFPGGAGQHQVRRRRLPDDHRVDRGPPLQELRRRHDRAPGARRPHHDRRGEPASPGVGRQRLVISAATPRTSGHSPLARYRACSRRSSIREQPAAAAAGLAGLRARRRPAPGRGRRIPARDSSKLQARGSPGCAWRETTRFVCAAALIGVVSALLNLDTAAAFLTPVLVHMARKRGAREAPVLYGCLLSYNAGSLLLPGRT